MNPRRTLTATERENVRLLAKRACLNAINENPLRFVQFFCHPIPGYSRVGMLLTKLLAETRLERTPAPVESEDEIADIAFRQAVGENTHPIFIPR